MNGSGARRASGSPQTSLHEMLERGQPIPPGFLSLFQILKVSTLLHLFFAFVSSYFVQYVSSHHHATPHSFVPRSFTDLFRKTRANAFIRPRGLNRCLVGTEGVQSGKRSTTSELPDHDVTPLGAPRRKASMHHFSFSVQRRASDFAMM